jgi:hypothetical protein
MKEKEEVRKRYYLQSEDGQCCDEVCSLDEAYGVYDRRFTAGAVKGPYKIVEATTTLKEVAKLVPKLTK